MYDSKTVKDYLHQAQNQICNMLETEETSQTFHTDEWQYSNKGGGESRVLEDGALIERGGVNFSHIQGNQLPAAASKKRPHLANNPFEAMGLSLVVHPVNPYVPTAHANFRFFNVTGGNKQPIWWFGGGFDLTPYYGFEDDCILWHEYAHQACQYLDDSAYPYYKKWCDDYFHMPHRQERRGIGGLFFDDVDQWPFDQCFEFIQACVENFQKAYQTIIQRRQHTPYGERERNFQNYRRGRYVEFNLLYDRGTLFGIQSGGRTESILISMPPVAHWHYNWHPEEGTPEKKLYDVFLQPQDWLNYQG